MFSTVASFRSIGSRIVSRRWLSASIDSISFGNGTTVKQAYDIAQKWLLSKNVHDYELSAQHLIAEAAKLGYRRSDFTRNFNKVLAPEELEKYAEFCRQRSIGVPIQYVIGNWDFYGLTFECKPPILIPRWETEELVQNILNTNLLQNIPNPKILDIGAGTGAIGVALAYELPGSCCDAIDINPAAVELANKNAAKILGDNALSRYNCFHSSFLDYINSGVGDGKFDLIVSNPPYVPSEEIPALQVEVRDHEDHGALDGGIDGLDIVKDIIMHFSTLMSDSGTKELWLEVAREHPAAIKIWIDQMHEKSHLLDVEWVAGISDSCGPRFVRLKCK